MKHTLSGIIRQSKAFGDVLKCVRGGQLPCSVLSVSQNAKPYFAGSLFDTSKKTVLFISSTEQAARDYAAAWGNGAALFPESDISLRNVEAKGRDSEMERVRVMKNSSGRNLVFLSVRSVITRLMPKAVFSSACLKLTAGESYGMQKLLDNIVKNGYERAGTVYSRGEYAKRGEILDIFPPDSEKALRITFFDDEIEQIRHFEIESQKSTGQKLESYVLPPVTEVVLTPEAKERVLEYLKKQPEGYEQIVGDIIYEIEEYGSFEIADSFLPIMYDSATIFDYFKDSILVFDDFERINAEAERIISEFTEEHSRLVKTNEAFAVQAETLISMRAATKGREGSIIDLAGVSHGGLKTVSEVDMDIFSAVGFNGRIDQLATSIKDRLAHGYSVYLYAGAKAESLSKALCDLDVIVPVLKDKPEDTKLAVLRDLVSYGFEIKSPPMLILGANDIYGRVKKKTSTQKHKTIAEDIFSDLKPGDYVVHDEHGKGRYLGLETIKAGGVKAEYMAIEYRGGDKLYIPAAQIENVQKYIGNEEGEVQLSKLGGKDWETAKAKVRESTLKLAFNLVDLYSARYENNGFAFSQDSVWQRQFEEAFEYEETDGQLKCVVEIKGDMESHRVMDRLLLGDVGYGKTEVAMRAVMKAVMDSKQVAILVPTTLLARQHIQTFRKRFENFPVTIEGITRFSKARHKQILADNARGKVDVLIGTHRLLSSDVKFNDLGLLIVDEEQRFGVNHKEKIKVMKKSVDVLTLSATPIPRTLEMSLTGIRDMSTIHTPPAMRVQPYSYVMRYSDGLLRDAVMRELARGGQAYFVCRQIRDMDKLRADLLKNVPEARVASAHGQMPEKEIEQVVSGFIDAEYDVLVCTTIIESGIDIPRVNTIIVYEADKFGLSQLYQLKGRVGRGDQASYAYFTYLGDGVMNENATKRLAAIREFTQLGSGYKIAMRDLQIRGAGNMMGAEQSGHMASVGYSMYVKLMSEAVKIARGKQIVPEFQTAVELNMPAYIPNNYIPEETDKMDIYRIISKIKGIADAKATSVEIADRYGKLPAEVNTLVLAAVIKSYAAKAGIASVIKKNETVELKFAENVQPNVKKVLKLAEQRHKNVILIESVPPVIVYKLPAGKLTKAFLEFLAELKKRG